MGGLSDRIAADAETERKTGADQEIVRICGLPILDELTEEEIEAFSRREVQAEFFNHPDPEIRFRLRPKQAEAVVTYDMHGGLFGPMGVGSGKTLVTLMIAARARRIHGVDLSFLTVPPEVYDQLVDIDIAWARRRVGLDVPFHFMGGKSRGERNMMIAARRKGCYILPYSLLSTEDGWRMLQELRPGLLIFDEVHRISREDSARGKRTRRYLNDYDPQVVALSGTITKKSIEDYQAVLVAALGENSPIPVLPNVACSWGAIIDAEADPSEVNAGPLQPLVDWAIRHFPDAEGRPPAGADLFRHSFQLRLSSAPGVVSTGDHVIPNSLIYVNHPAPLPDKKDPDWLKLLEHIDTVEDLWESPSGDQIDYAFHKWQYLSQLNAGFFYFQRWPTVEQLMERRDWTEDEARGMLERAMQHHAAQQDYHKVLRVFLNGEHLPGLDTPMLVGNRMHAYRQGHIDALPVPQMLYESWCAMKDLQIEGLPERDQIPTRVCDYKIKHAVDWALEVHKDRRRPTGGLLWVFHAAMGEWLYERLREADLPVLYCPSEGERTGSNRAIRDEKNVNQFIVASIKAHHIGKNLQHHQNMLTVQWPREADIAEQLVGRVHRDGQKADEVYAERMDTTAWDKQNFCSCLCDALYQHMTVGSAQKLIYGTHRTPPSLYPPGFLRENGFQNRLLRSNEERLLKERFQQ